MKSNINREKSIKNQQVLNNQIHDRNNFSSHNWPTRKQQFEFYQMKYHTIGTIENATRKQEPLLFWKLLSMFFISGASYLP